MTTVISNTDDSIDSRDVIERLEELRGELESYHDEQETTLSFEYALQDAANFPDHADEFAEYATLQSLAEQGEQYAPDWNYGEQLIRDSYFEQAMDEMVADCYELPKDLPFWMIVTYDYDALRQDYTEIDFDGVTYLIR